MPARTTVILAAAMAAAFATTLPAQAADRLGADDGGLDDALGGLLDRNEGDLFDDEGERRMRRPASASTTPMTRSGTTAATRRISIAWSTPRATATRSGCSST
jgi:hypothetical protein